MSASAEVLAGEQPQGITDTQSLPGGVQAPETAPVPQSAEEWESTLDTLDSEQLGALLSAPPAPQPAAQEEAPPAVNAPPGDEEDEEEAPVVTPVVPPAALAAPGGPPTRIRLNGLPQETASKVAQYVEAIRSGKSPEEAAAIIAPPAPAPAQAAEQAPPEPTLQNARQDSSTPESPGIDAAKARVTEAEQALEAAQASYDAVEISKCTLALIDAKAELKDAERSAVRAAESAQAYSTQFDQHVATLKEAFPDLKDDNSALSIRLLELRDIESVRNPGFDDDPAFILRLAAKAAQDVGARSAATVSIPQPSQAPRPQGRVVPNGQPVAKAMTKEEANRQFDQVLARMSDEEQQEFLANILPIPG